MDEPVHAEADLSAWRESLRGLYHGPGAYRSFCSNCDAPIIVRTKEDCDLFRLCLDCAAGENNIDSSANRQGAFAEDWNLSNKEN